MASFKITDLTELASGSVADTDVLEIVDLDADQSKKVTIASLKTVFSASEGSAYTGGTSNGIMFNDGGTFATSSNFVFDGETLTHTLTNGQTADAFQINSFGNTGGDLFNITSDGKVGIGIYPNVGLHVSSDEISFVSKTSANMNMYVTPSTGKHFSFFNIRQNSDFIFKQSVGGSVGTTTFIIKGDTGNVGIGATSPSAKLQTTLSTDIVGNRLDLSNGQTADAFQINSFGNTGGDLFKVTSGGSVGIGTTSPVTPFHIHADPAVNGLFAADLVSSISGTQNLFRFGTNGFTNTIFAVKATASVVSFSSWDNNNVIVLNNSGNVGIGATSIDASAKFQIDSTTQGVLLPRMTTTERDAISSPANGLLIYNTTANQFQYYNAGLANWAAV